MQLLSGLQGTVYGYRFQTCGKMRRKSYFFYIIQLKTLQCKFSE